MFTSIWYVALGTFFEPDASKQPNNIKIRDFERVVFDKRIELYYKSVLLGHDIENTDVFDALKLQNIFLFPKKQGNENIIWQKP